MATASLPSEDDNHHDEAPRPARRPESGSGSHAHRRASESETRRHRRVDDDTPENGIKLSSKGITFPWGKVFAALMAIGAVVTGGATTFAVTRPPPTVDLHQSFDDKLDRIIEAVQRIEKKTDTLDERERTIELEVAALKARQEKDRPR